MFQVLDVKLGTNLKSPDSSFTCTTLGCYSVLLLACYTANYSLLAENYGHIAKIIKFFSQIEHIFSSFQRVSSIFEYDFYIPNKEEVGNKTVLGIF